MKTSTVDINEITGGFRLDSPYYLSEGRRANRIIKNYINAGNKSVLLGDEKLISIWQPNRNTLVYGGEGETTVPYLQPYDILEYLPTSRSDISSHQNDIESLRVKAGTLLLTCSGRNLGPLVIADEYIEQFVFGSDLIRMEISDDSLKYYIFAFLSTWIGQALLHSNKTGSVIDHLSKKDVAALLIPLLDEKCFSTISQTMQKSYELYASARKSLNESQKKFNKIVGIERASKKLCKGWGIGFNDLFNANRLDAAFFDPYTAKAAKDLEAVGGIRLKCVADVIKPSGRYKTTYVEKEYGKPLISGRQLLQDQIVGLKYLPSNREKLYKEFVLLDNTIAFPADGRVEGRLGTPTFITASRAGWFASGHIERIIPHNNINPGYIYLAFSHPAVQAQIYSVACGSVVDAVYSNDVENVVIPPMIEFDYDTVVLAWKQIDIAKELKEKACSIITEELTQFD